MTAPSKTVALELIRREAPVQAWTPEKPNPDPQYRQAMALVLDSHGGIPEAGSRHTVIDTTARAVAFHGPGVEARNVSGVRRRWPTTIST